MAFFSSTGTLAPTVSIATTASHSGGFSANGSGTYTTPAGVAYLRVKMVGGGGAGGPSYTGSGGTSGDGTASSLGSVPLLNAAQGLGASNSYNSNVGGVGGAPTINTGPIVVVAISGATGSGGSIGTASGQYNSGGAGGSSFFGGNGPATSAVGGAAGVAAIAKSGSGGGGAGQGGTSSIYTGGGGGAGAYLEVIIVNPAASYAFVAGAGGTPTATDATYEGGAGGSGIIIIEEYYQ